MMCTEVRTEPVCYVRPSIMQLVEQSIEARRRDREENPLVFRRYAESLLRSLNIHNENR